MLNDLIGPHPHFSPSCLLPNPMGLRLDLIGKERRGRERVKRNEPFRPPSEREEVRKEGS